MKRCITYLNLVLILSCSLFFYGCEEQEEQYYKKVRLSKRQAEKVNPPLSPTFPLRIAVAPVISSRESYKFYNNLIEYIASRLGKSAIFIQGRDYAEINNLLRYGHCEAAFVCDYAYLQGQSDFNMELLVVPQINGKSTYRSYIIAHEESQIQSFWDLEGKSFAFADPLSTSGYLYPIYLLKNPGKKPEGFFSKTIFTYGHDNSIKAVSQGLVDGAAVDSLVYDYMISQKEKYNLKVKVIHKSPEWTSPPVVVNPNIDPEIRLRLKEAFLSMYKHKEGKWILDKLMIDKFITLEDKAYDSIRKMAKEIGY